MYREMLMKEAAARDFRQSQGEIYILDGPFKGAKLRLGIRL